MSRYNCMSFAAKVFVILRDVGVCFIRNDGMTKVVQTVSKNCLSIAFTQNTSLCWESFNQHKTHAKIVFVIVI
jgi:hypothetical protein